MRDLSFSLVHLMLLLWHLNCRKRKRKEKKTGNVGKSTIKFEQLWRYLLTIFTVIHFSSFLFYYYSFHCMRNGRSTFTDGKLFAERFFLSFGNSVLLSIVALSRTWKKKKSKNLRKMKMIYTYYAMIPSNQINCR